MTFLMIEQRKEQVYNGRESLFERRAVVSEDSTKVGSCKTCKIRIQEKYIFQSSVSQDPDIYLMTCKIYNNQTSGYSYSRLQVFKVLGIQGSRYSRFQVFKVLGIQGSMYSRFQGFKVLGIQGSRYSRCQVFKVLAIQGSRYSRFQVFKVLAIQGSRYSRFQVFKVLGI